MHYRFLPPASLVFEHKVLTRQIREIIYTIVFGPLLILEEKVFWTGDRRLL